MDYDNPRYLEPSCSSDCSKALTGSPVFAPEPANPTKCYLQMSGVKNKSVDHRRYTLPHHQPNGLHNYSYHTAGSGAFSWVSGFRCKPVNQ